MASCDQITIERLVRSWLDILEVEYLNHRAESIALLRIQNTGYTQRQADYASWKLDTLRLIRQRIPNAWKKAIVKELT